MKNMYYKPNINPVVEDIPEANSIFINQIVYDKKSRGERVYTYSLGEAFFDIPRYPLTEEEFYDGYHYSDSRGLLELRRHIGDMYKSLYGVNVNAEKEILVSAGSKAIIFMVLKTILSSGDEVLVHEPAWLSYREQIKLADGKYIAIPYDSNVYDWEKFITKKTKVVIINNPNNPSGKLYSKKELEYLFELACKYNIFVLSDEAYSDFLLANEQFVSFADIDSQKNHCIVVNSLSKNMGMSGWRIGYVITNEYLIHQILKLNQHIITCAPTILQRYIAKYYNQILKKTLPQAQEIARKRVAVQHIMNELGISCLQGVGTFYFFIDVSCFIGSVDELVYMLLFDYNIATVPGESYGVTTKRFIRFGIGVESLNDIKKSLLIIKKLLDSKSIDFTELRCRMKKYGINGII